MQLNPEQQRAVETTEGPLLIIAGAGSGKTRVLTERLGKIITEGLAVPHETLVVTFTNKAAAELRRRVEERVGGRQFFPWLGTFHSMCLKLLRIDGDKLGLDRNFTIYDTEDQLSVVKEALGALNLNTKEVNPKAILSQISAAKQELLTPERFAVTAKGYAQELAADIYRHYQANLVRNSAVDFDDLLFYGVRLLKEHEEVRLKYATQFKYVMVDEYQDTNQAQYLLVKYLSSVHKNICVVGDDDQGIYSWRGATIRNILEFEIDFHPATVIKLEQNYRSTKKILQASHNIISGVTSRKGKELWTDNTDGENVTIYNALDEKEESYWVVEQIESLIQKNVDPEEMAVLYRMNAQSRMIEEVLVKAGIPYRIVGSVRFYERKEIKDAMAYLKLVYNPADTVALLRIINIPTRKIGAKTIKDLLAKATAMQMNAIDYLLTYNEKLAPALKNFAELVQKLYDYANEHTVNQLLTFMLTESGYTKMLADGTEDGRQRQSNLEELINVTAKYSEMSPQASLQAFLEEAALIEDQGRSRSAGQSRNYAGDEAAELPQVTLMTIHAAKGLEFSHVFIIGAEEGIFPHSRAFINPAELDEERRLAYVAITRAKARVYLIYANSRSVFGRQSSSIPSRFLSEIDQDIVDYKSYTSSGYRDPIITENDFGGDWSNIYSNQRSLGNKGRSAVKPSGTFAVNAGDRVVHQQFGKGTVISIDEDTVLISFDREGKKEMATEYAQLQPI